MIYFVGFIIIFFFILIYYNIYKWRGISFLFNNPLLLSSYFFLLIHLILPILQWKDVFFRYGNYSEITYIYSIIYTFGLFVIFSFIFAIDPLKIKYNFSKYQLDCKNEKRFLYGIWFIFIIAIYFSLSYMVKILTTGLDVYLTDRLSFSEGGSALKILLAHWIYISCILFFCGYLIAEYYKRLFLFSFILSLIYCVAYYGLNSNRNSIFILGIILFVIYFFIGKKYIKLKLNFLHLIIFGLVFSSFFYFVGKFRNSIKDYNSEDYSLSTSLNGGFGNHENIVWLLENNHNLLLGKTYLASFFNIIPRSLWDNKPYGAGPELKNMINPGSYVLGQEGNSSLTTGFFTEALMNFGILGSFVFVFFVSIIIYILLAKIKSINNFFFQILFIYIFVLFSSQFFYAEFLGFYTRTLITIVPILVLVFFIRFERKLQ